MRIKRIYYFISTCMDANYAVDSKDFQGPTIYLYTVRIFHKAFKDLPRSSKNRTKYNDYVLCYTVVSNRKD